MKSDTTIFFNSNAVQIPCNDMHGLERRYVDQSYEIKWDIYLGKLWKHMCEAVT